MKVLFLDFDGVLNRYCVHKDVHPDLRIVVSSTWRMSFGKEIQEWIEGRSKPSAAAGGEVTHYAILDDDADMLPEQKPHFVQINGYKGLSDSDVQQVIQVLNKEIK